MIGRAPYGHGAVLGAILDAELRGSHQPARGTPSNGSASAASPARSLGDEREPRAYHREPGASQRPPTAKHER